MFSKQTQNINHHVWLGICQVCATTFHSQLPTKVLPAETWSTHDKAWWAYLEIRAAHTKCCLNVLSYNFMFSFNYRIFYYFVNLLRVFIINISSSSLRSLILKQLFYFCSVKFVCMKKFNNLEKNCMKWMNECFKEDIQVLWEFEMLHQVGQESNFPCWSLVKMELYTSDFVQTENIGL